MTKSWHAEDSPWKAKQIQKMLNRNDIEAKEIIEVGCGVGEVLVQLQKRIGNDNIYFEGFDIAQDAIEIAKLKENGNLKFHCKDFIKSNEAGYDLLLMIDVFEHVPNYISFVEDCKKKAQLKLYHIPLDIHVSSIMRNKLLSARKSVGHIHYFTKETALATIQDTGQKIIDFFYTDGVMGLPNRKFRTRLLNIPRKIMYPIAPDFTAKLIGGYSLMVLAE